MDKKSLLLVALGAVLATALFASLIMFQILVPAQPAQIPKQSQAPATLEKFKAFAGGTPNCIDCFLIINAGTERGIWANNGLAPEWVYSGGVQTPATIKEQVASGVKIGHFAIGNVLIARSQDVPIKIFGCYTGENRANQVYVRADSPIKSMKDLDGKKIGVTGIDTGTGRNVLYISNKLGIKPEIVPLGNVTNMVVALKLGRIDAFLDATSSPLRLVDSGELRIIASSSDFTPKPWAGGCVVATEDLIEQNPDLVKRFVKATMETVGYIKDNPSYAADLYIKQTNAPKDIAKKVITVIDWTPSGRGSGSDLIVAARNLWQYLKETGVLPLTLT